MNDDPKISSRTRAVMHDSHRKRGYALPMQFKNSRPRVTWRCTTCRGRILRLYLGLEGWYLHGENFRVPLPEWFERTSENPDSDLAAYRDKKLFATHPREVRGMQELLPLDVADWPSKARFTAGCKKCGEAIFSLDELAADAGEVGATRPAKECSKVRPIL